MEKDFRRLLTGGDRRGIADSAQVRALIERRPARIKELAALAADVPYKKIFIGPLAESDKWEIRLQIVRALPLFRWTPAQARRVEAILTANIDFPQTFVRAWALDSLATLSARKPRLAKVVMRQLAIFEQSPSKALQARARAIRERLVAP